MYIPRLRKKSNAISYIKKMDKRTALTGYLIEQLANTGKITQIKFGNAYLINLDEVIDYFRRKEEDK